MENITKKIAFDLFRIWTKQAIIDYPNNDFTIIDETNLVYDLKNTLSSAVRCLVKEEKAEQRKILGYDFGFIIGFIQGNLNKHWFNEYIIKRTDLYKGFVINKAIIEYLKFDNLTRIRVKSIYENILEEELNLNIYDFSISENEIQKYEIDKIKSNNDYINDSNSVIIYLENRIKEQIVEIVEISEPDYLSKIDYLFTNEYITELIMSYENKNK
jgi:hypothetical protein